MSQTASTDERRGLLKAALVRIEELEAKLSATEERGQEPIAVVGLSCRFPAGANDPESFWNLLSSGSDAVTEVPRERWNIDEYFDQDPDAAGKTYSRWGGFLDQVDRFDADFFGIAPREAVLMDPQQRLLLEVSWEALEHAGIAPAGLKGSATGVFLGHTASDFSHLIARAGTGAISDAYIGSGSAPSVAAGRLSYTLGLQGPCITLDTACSSSLVAVHMACQSLRTRECHLALASGVSLILSPDGHIMASKGRMLSPDGRCFTFDSRANGYVRSEGCGVVVLKRLSDAQTDGDRVLAVIRGSAINQDGRSSGLTAPNGRAQEDVMRLALDAAGVQPEDISYVEAHGTGTSLGDPIEVEALAAVHAARHLDAPVLIGSVKSNIGHLEAAAGVAALIKIVLSLQKRQLPPHLHFREPNPHIRWSALPVKVAGELAPWPGGYERRLAGISSFGFSGTNAHLIVEGIVDDAEDTTNEPASGAQITILPLSAKSEPALRAAAAKYASALRSAKAASFRDICFTAATGRSHHELRLSVAADNALAAAEGLEAFGAGAPTHAVFTAPAVRRAVQPVFVFGGQGSQYAGMGSHLFESEPVFRVAMHRCDEILEPLLPCRLLDVIYPEPQRAAEADRMLCRTEFTQPALFAIEYALTELWKSWGVQPAAVIGHSIGEYAAACSAGVFRLEDSLRLVAERGRLMQSLPEGGVMMAVMAEPERVSPFLHGAGQNVAIAAINGPQHVVISGSHAGVADCAARLVASGIATRALDVSHAFHSALLDPILDEFERTASRVRTSVPHIDVISNLTGVEFDESKPVDGAYWRNHARNTVRFAEGIEALRRRGHSLFLEIAPNASLSRLGRSSRHPDSNELWLSSIRRDADGSSLMESVAALYAHGVRIGWDAFYHGRAGRKVSLPTYPFQRERFWWVPPPQARPAVPDGVVHPLLGRRLRSPKLSETVFQSVLETTHPPFLNDHRIAGRTIVPASAYLEMAAAAAAERWGAGVHEVCEVAIREPIVLDGGPRLVQTVIGSGDVTSLEICSSSESDDDSAWITHATATLSREPAHRTPANALASDATAEHDPAEYYDTLRAAGAEYGPAFRLLTGIRSGAGTAAGSIAAGSVIGTSFHLHPAVLDAAFQLAGIALSTLPNPVDGLFVPVRVAAYRCFRSPSDALGAQVSVRDSGAQGSTFTCDVVLADAAGEVARIDGLIFRRISGGASHFGEAAGLRDSVFTLEWQAQDSSLGLSAEPLVEGGTWLVFDDAVSWATDLAGRLSQHPVVHVRRGDAYAPPHQGVAVVRPDQPEDFVRLLQDAGGTAQIAGALHLWNLTAVCASDTCCVDLLCTAQALLSLGATGTVPRLTIVTRGAQPVGGAEPHTDVYQAAAWGFARTLAAEEPTLRATIVDLDPEEIVETQLELLLRHARISEPSEGQLAIRAGRLYVPRLVPKLETPSESRRLALPSEGVGFSLEIAERGVLDDLNLQPFTLGPPRAGEVQIEIAASGLNFRDVLNALGMYPGDPGPLGNECAGTISVLGDGVEGLVVGDLVMALTPRALCSRVNTSASLVFRVPAGMSMLDAAAIPLAFQTAYYALVHVARLKRGDRVLIHAAAGGVGLAAVQIAQSIGAEIFATAGTASKRALLSRMGVPHVMSSRTLDFAGGVRRVTGDAGVDVVLNSLAGDFIPRSLDVVADGGCFLELGKAGILSAAGVRRDRPKVRYEVVFLGDVCANDAPRIQRIYRELMKKFEAGSLQPLPKVVFPIDRSCQAFRFMAQARHTGKIVVSSRGSAAPGALRGDATYVITGGLGALGLHTAQWMGRRGARRIVLVGRRRPSPEAETSIAELTAAGVEVIVAQADVADRNALASVLEKSCTLAAPLRGIVHAAGETDSSLVRRQSGARFAKVFAAKLTGAMNLDVLTRELDLDFFVLYSAGAAILGSPGLASYAAANASLDALAAERRACGLPAVSIDWGPWSGAGMAAGVSQADRDRWAGQGICMIDPEFGVAALEAIIASDVTQAAVLPVKWAAMTNPPAILRDFAPAQISAPALSRTEATHLSARLAAADIGDRPELLRAFVREQVAQVLGLKGIQKRDDDRGFADLGLDSLMAVELSNRLGAAIGQKLSSTVAFDRATVSALADYLAGLLDSQPRAAGAPSDSSVADASGLDALPYALTASMLSTNGIQVEPQSSHAMLEMSDGQRALWFLHQLAPESAAYNIAFSIQIRGEVDSAVLRTAFQVLVDRHSILRTTFVIDAHPVQRVAAFASVAMEEIDASSWSAEELCEQVKSAAQRPFNLANAPPLRVSLFRRTADDNVLLVMIHHIAFDGGSTPVLFREFKEALLAASSRKPAELEPSPVQYSDFVQWQNDLISGSIGQRDREYWLRELSGKLPVFKLFDGWDRAPVLGEGADEFPFVLSVRQSAGLKDLAAREGTTLFVVLLAAYRALLRSETGADDLIIGSPFAGRTNPRFASVIGCFVNTAPIRLVVRGDTAFRALITAATGKVRDALEHQNYPFVRMVQDLNVRRDPSRSPVFQTMFNFMTVQGHSDLAQLFGPEEFARPVQVGPLTLERFLPPSQPGQFELQLEVVDIGGSLSGHMKYDTALYGKRSIERLAERFLRLLDEVVADPGRPLDWYLQSTSALAADRPDREDREEFEI